MATKQRSPRYPVYDLAKALELLRKLYSSVSRGEFQPSDAATAWGYTKVSGATNGKIATLRQYGLIEGKTGGKGAVAPKLSLRGLTLARRNPAVPDREYMSEIKEAALTPPIFKEIHELPDATDERLQHRLVVDYKFTEEGAKRCIEAYRATIRLAELDKNELLSGTKPDVSNDNDVSKNVHPDIVNAEVGSPGMMKIMLSAEDEDFAWVKREMTEDEWNLRLSLFQAYKPAIVRGKKESPISV